MKRTYLTCIAAATTMLAGCATQPKTTFWERKGDMVLVHHFDGLSDQVETLTNNTLPGDALKPGSFPKGQYFAVGQKEYQVKKVVSPQTPTKNSNPDVDNLAAVNKELRSLRNQISAVQAENHRLQDQLGDRIDSKTPNAKPLSAANAAAIQEEPQLVETPRLSQ